MSLFAWEGGQNSKIVRGIISCLVCFFHHCKNTLDLNMMGVSIRSNYEFLTNYRFNLVIVSLALGLGFSFRKASGPEHMSNYNTTSRKKMSYALPPKLHEVSAKSFTGGWPPRYNNKQQK